MSVSEYLETESEDGTHFESQLRRLNSQNQLIWKDELLELNDE